MYGGHVSGRIHAPSFWIPSNLQKIAEIPSNLDRLCRKWHEKSTKNDRKMKARASARVRARDRARARARASARAKARARARANARVRARA